MDKVRFREERGMEVCSIGPYHYRISCLERDLCTGFKCNGHGNGDYGSLGSDVLAVRKEGDELWTVLDYPFAEIFLRVVMSNPEKWGIPAYKRVLIIRYYKHFSESRFGGGLKFQTHHVTVDFDDMNVDEYEAWLRDPSKGDSIWAR